jgi:UDP-N-acetylmuramoyl-tripeptide--D-alanyl-D-alanine ligase
LFAVGRQAGEIAGAARRGGLRAVEEILEVEKAAAAVLQFVRPGDVVLIKASRVAGLERVGEALRGKPAVIPGN